MYKYILLIALCAFNGNTFASISNTDACDDYINNKFNPDQLFNSVSRSLLVGYSKVALEIEYKMVESGVTPFAISPDKGHKIIEIPRAFIASACYFSVASSLGFDLLSIGDNKLAENTTKLYVIWEKAKTAKDSCQTDNRNYDYDKCFLAYARMVSLSADELRKTNKIAPEPLTKERIIYETESLIYSVISKKKGPGSIKRIGNQ